MKKLLLLISVLFATQAYCQDKPTLPAPSAAAAGKTTAKSGAAGTSGKSIAMRRKKKRKTTEVTHAAPNQEQIDSIKKVKTKTKK
jgi:hypothetical protein